MSNEIKEYLEAGKKNILLIYVLFLCGIIIPILPIIGAVFAFANKDDKSALWRSHYVFAFRTFAFGILGAFIAMITMFVFIGQIIYALMFIWFVVRSIIAVQHVLASEPHPNPMTLWIK